MFHYSRLVYNHRPRGFVAGVRPTLPYLIRGLTLGTLQTDRVQELEGAAIR